MARISEEMKEACLECGMDPHDGKDAEESVQIFLSNLQVRSD